MIEILKLMKIPNKLIRLVKMTVQNTRAVVEIEHERSEKFNINTGLRKGNALSTVLFNNNSIYPTNAHSLLCKTLYRFANMFRSRGIIIRAPYTLNIVMLLHILYI
jgi:hypothetical protein